MPGVSHRGPVAGALGVGKVHLTFKPKKIRSSHGFYVYCLGLCVLLFAIFWSNPYYKNKYNLPLVRAIFSAYNSYTDISLKLGNMDLVNENIKANISIVRDNNGVPYIHGEDINDVIFGQGYMHACDRWIQMEIMRRKALGSLNELFGSDALNSDSIAQSLNIKFLAENDLTLLTLTEKTILQAYTNGVNAYLNQLSNRLPYHYSLINTNISSIEPWDIIHTLALLRMYAYEYSHGWEDDLINLIFSISNVKIDDFNNLNTNSKSNNIKSSTSGSSWVIAGKHRNHNKSQQKNNAYMGINFNSYVHKDNNWYINSLKSDKLNVVGSSIPGIPLVLMGHNGNIAWGYSISSTSNEHLYINNKSYNNNNDLSSYDNNQDKTCQIKDKFIPLENIMPMNVALYTLSKSYKLSFESDALKLNTPPITLDNLLKLNLANDWSSFSHTLQQMNNVALQFSYMDNNGNIGHFDTKSNSIYNPKDGYIIIDDTFDNKINGNSYINFLIHSYHHSDNNSLNVNDESMLKLFTDTFSSSSIKLCNIVQLLKGNINIIDDLKIFDLIDQFDGYYSSTSKLPLFLESFRLELRNGFLKLITKNKVSIESYLSGQSFLSSFNQKSKYIYKNNLNWLIDIILSSNNNHDVIFKEANGLIEFLLDTYNRTVQRCHKKYGLNINNWPVWSDVHQGLLQQVYSDNYSLFMKSLISHGPTGIAGGIDSVMNSWFDADHSYSYHSRKTKIPIKPAKITSLRLVYDMQELDNTLYNIPSTPCINYGSRWSDDMYHTSFDLWAKGNMNKILCWSNECINKNKAIEFNIMKTN